MKNLESYDLEVLSKNEQTNVSGGVSVDCIAVGAILIAVGLITTL